MFVHLSLHECNLLFKRCALLAHPAAHVCALRVLRPSSFPELLGVREQTLRDREPSLELSGT
eukprot:9877554-Alexandrium_andersonii.AAC.1